MLTEKTAKLIVRKKTDITHFETNDGEKKTKLLVYVGNEGPGDAWEECTCFLEVVNDELVIYPNDRHMQGYLEDFNFSKLIEGLINDVNHGQEIYEHSSDKKFLSVKKEKVDVQDIKLSEVDPQDFLTEPNQEEVKAPIIGEFKTKKKFLNFISAASIKGQKVRFNSETAFIKGSFLSGMLDKATFKMTICDEGTINFEEVDGTSLSDKDMIKRLIADIEEAEVTGYAQKFVLKGLEFRDEENNLCYLEVEHQKPIDKLRSIFDEENTKKEEIKKLSSKGLSVLDSLFTDDNDYDEVEDDEEIVDENVVEVENVDTTETKSESVSYLEESFKKMNENKVNELKERINEANVEIKKSEFEMKSAENKIKKLQENLNVLETRLDNMGLTEPANGYVFFVSEEKKHETGLDESTKHIADKIADIMKLKKDVLFDMLTEGYHLIKLAKKNTDYSLDINSVSLEGKTKEETDELINQALELNRMYSSLTNIDRNGKFTQTDDGVEYRGELNWHQLVSKLIKNGFEQDHEFDKISGSNSYINTTEQYVEKSEDDTDEITNDIIENDTEDLVEVDDNYHTQELMTFDKPTDVIIWSAPDEANQSVDINITDDYADLEVRVGGKEMDESIETVGFVSISTYKEYEKFINKYGTEQLGGTTALLLPNFKGEIRIGVQLDKGGYAKDFDPNDDLYYTQGGGQPFIDLPVDTEIINIDEDHDLSKLKSFVRDQKLTDLGIN
jgi:hypothetical protein